MKAVFGAMVLGIGTSLTVFSPAVAQTTVISCSEQDLRVVVHNLGSASRSGYIAGASPIHFSVGSKGEQELSVPAPKPGEEHRLQTYLPDETPVDAMEGMPADESNGCDGYVELPSGCPDEHVAAHLYLYDSPSRGGQCFVRSVAHLPRTRSSALALKK